MLHYYAVKVLKDDGPKNLLEIFYHARKCKTAETFNIWLKESISEEEEITPIGLLLKYQERGEQNILIQIIDGIRSDFDLNDLSISLLNIYVDIVHLGGDYSTAVEICDKYLERFSIQEIMEDEQLIKMRIRRIHHSMFFMPVRYANDLCQKA